MIKLSPSASRLPLAVLAAALVCLPAALTRAETARPSISLKDQTALDGYVAAPDSSFGWKLASSTPLPGGGSFDVIELTSQTWLTEKEVDKPVWKHWLNIVRPAKIAHGTAMLFIGGGSNDKPAPDKPDGNLAGIAMVTGSVVAELKGVPSQPLEFDHDGQKRVEDQMVSLTWDRFLRTGDERWPARLPMTKSAVRAMDAITAHCATAAGGGAEVNKFFVTGASKRGWTTWTTAAVDPRVVAIAPIVIDVLNVAENLEHHWQAYGFWAPAVGDYTNIRLMDWHRTERFAALMKIEDPWEYRARFTMPKFIINAAGDQFFLPDSSRFYFDALPGVKYLRYVPNADHSLKGSDAYSTLLACYDGILRGAEFPKFAWKDEADGSTRITCITPPEKVTVWTANNPEARDFRLESLGPKWQSAALTAADPAQPGEFLVKPAAPAKGWTASFTELTFPSGGKAPWKFTTSVRITPDTLPHSWPPPDLRPPPVNQ
jgi:PhoPQ-activated pathogenicity-related protein